MVEVDRALDALAARMLARGNDPTPSDYAAAFDALEAAPLRVGPVDWTRPVEGWRLW